jgi:hypothetical protein
MQWIGIVSILIFFLWQPPVAESSSDSVKDEPVAQCMVYSDLHCQYLYRSRSLFSWHNRVYTWAPTAFTFQNSYNYNYEYTKKDTKGL